MISAPASANARAIALPMPLVPPVTNAVFPLKSKKLGIAIVIELNLVFLSDYLEIKKIRK